MKRNTGVLITNIGSPTHPTATAVRRYLRRFLTDPRVIEIPRLLWYPILYGIILPLRAKSSAKLYKKIWTPQGSPLTIFCQSVAKKLAAHLDTFVVLGTHYGNPSIPKALHQLQESGVEKIVVLPLYPQYSATSTGSTFDIVINELKSWRDLPELHFIKSYATHPKYIAAIANSITAYWQQHGKPEHLLFSFHGIPERNIKLGDPYADECHETAELVAEYLHLEKSSWSLAFQSRLGRAKWLSPYTDHVLQELPRNGISNLHVICPGFAVDCLETLEEIAIRGKEQFFSAGGKQFHYIPALNDSQAQIEMLADLV